MLLSSNFWVYTAKAENTKPMHYEQERENSWLQKQKNQHLIYNIT